jgi:hypothetical protein
MVRGLLRFARNDKWRVFQKSQCIKQERASHKFRTQKLRFLFSVFACLFGLKRGWRFNLSMVVVYIVAYGALSANGQYISGNHGGNDNREIWYAKWCGMQTIKYSGRLGSEPTLLGVFFWPAAIVDKILIHKDIVDNR